MGGNGLTGGCQCGAVRFRVDGETEAANICHCRMCQKASGQPFMAFARVEARRFAVTHGALAKFHSSETVERGFCSACGTPLTYRNVTGDRISYTICALDHPAAVAPTGQLAAEFAVPWLSSALATANVRLDDWLKTKQVPEVGARQPPDPD